MRDVKGKRDLTDLQEIWAHPVHRDCKLVLVSGIHSSHRKQFVHFLLMPTRRDFLDHPERLACKERRARRVESERQAQWE